MPTFRTSRPGSAADPSRPHVILVGLPGAGKTTVGRAVAEKLGRTFLDIDAEIERREGRTVAEIFAEKGEPAFRDMERRVTEELAELGGMIIAPGGGWTTNPEVVALLRPPARLIYLQVRPATAIARLGTDRLSRPLLSRPNPLAELERLLDRRKAAYETADAVVNTELKDLQQVINEVAELASAAG